MSILPYLPDATPVVLSLCDLNPVSKPIVCVKRVRFAETRTVESIGPIDGYCRDACADLVAKLDAFVAGMREFIAEGFCGAEVLTCEPYMSAGFFESCMCVHLLILEELETFFEPTIICDVFEYDGSLYEDTKYLFFCMFARAWFKVIVSQCFCLIGGRGPRL